MTSLLTPQKLKLLKRMAFQAYQAPGCVAEVGVYRGGSAKVIAAEIPSSPFYLFDTFTGLPAPGPHDGPVLRAGRFAATVDEVHRTLRGSPNRSIFYQQGVFPESAAGLEALRFCFVHVDVDLFRSVSDCCVWFAPRMTQGGIMVFDDYGCKLTPGCPLAVDAYFGDRAQATPEGPAVVHF